MSEVFDLANDGKLRAVTVHEADLPPGARNLIRLLGWADAAALIDTLGGIPFPVPKGEDNNPGGAARFAQLAELVGEDGARAIVAEYGGDRLLIPNCRRALARARMRAMRESYDAGATAEEVALEFRCSYRWVMNVLKMSDETSAESGIFELPAQGRLF